MNKTIIFPEIIVELSRLTNLSHALSELFLQEMVSLIAERLIEGETVTIKKIGKFQFTEKSEIKFLPDPDLSDAVNSAFNSFEPVELAEEFEVNESDADVVSNPIEGQTYQQTNQTVGSENQNPVSPEDKQEETSSIESSPVENSPSETDVITFGLEESETEDALPEPVPENNRSLHFGRWYFLWGMAVGIVLSAIAVTVYWLAADSDPAEKAATVSTHTPDAQNQMALLNDTSGMCTESTAIDLSKADTTHRATIDHSSTVTEKTEEGKLYTVTSDSYLSNISRKYYGHYLFWVYIYIENKDKIKDPNNLPVGIQIVIPPASKYGIDRNDAESLSKAQRIATDLLEGKR